MVKSFLTKTPSQTKKLGEILAKEILKTKFKEAVILGLSGELGGGKTTFLQGFAKGLGVKEKILSPTFVIIKRFKILRTRTSSVRGRQDLTPHQKLRFGTGQGFKNFYHIDCYRIRKPKEILDMGFKKIISNPQNIVAVEWAERVKNFLPKSALILKFKFINRIKRKIVLNSNDDRRKKTVNYHR